MDSKVTLQISQRYMKSMEEAKASGRYPLIMTQQMPKQNDVNKKDQDKLEVDVQRGLITRANNSGKKRKVPYYDHATHFQGQGKAMLLCTTDFYQRN